MILNDDHITIIKHWFGHLNSVVSFSSCMSACVCASERQAGRWMKMSLLRVNLPEPCADSCIDVTLASLTSHKSKHLSVIISFLSLSRLSFSLLFCNLLLYNIQATSSWHKSIFITFWDQLNAQWYWISDHKKALLRRFMAWLLAILQAFSTISAYMRL